MIFSREYDRALWLVLYSDKNNRERIINFIKSIPKELHEEICKSLVKFYDYQRENVDVLEREEGLSGECIVSLPLGDCKYWFMVDTILGSLSIGRVIDGKNDLEITLFYGNENYKSGKLEEQMLGSISFNGSKLENTSYTLLNTLFGMVVMSMNNGNVRRFKRVDSEMIPIDIDKSNLDKNNRLVRLRNRCRIHY